MNGLKLSIYTNGLIKSFATHFMTHITTSSISNSKKAPPIPRMMAKRSVENKRKYGRIKSIIYFIFLCLKGLEKCLLTGRLVQDDFGQYTEAPLLWYTVGHVEIETLWD